MVKKGVADDMTIMMSENQSSASQVHVTALWSTEDLAVKSLFK
jgi:hypothetical protein